MASQSVALAFSQVPEPATTGNWSLTTESFELLLKQLDADREEAARKYVALYFKLNRFFEWRGCSNPDWLADETMTRIARRIEQGITITNFQGFMFGVARKIAIESLKEREKEQKMLTSLSPQVEDHDDRIYVDELMARLDAGLLKLPPNGRRLLIAYHAAGDDKNMKIRRELAQREGISVNALRVRVHRLKMTLEAYIKTDLDRELPSSFSGATLYAI